MGKYLENIQRIFWINIWKRGLINSQSICRGKIREEAGEIFITREIREVISRVE